MSDDQELCLVCQKPVVARPHGAGYDVKCQLCGRYRISRIGLTRARTLGLEGDDSHFAMCAIRNLSARGTVITFAEDTVQRLRDAVVPPKNPIETVDLLLEHVARRTKGIPSQEVKLQPDLYYPLIFAHSPSELRYHVKNAAELGYLDGVTPALVSGKYWVVTITLDGWRRLEEVKRTRPDSRQAFVAMWFHKDLDDAWESGFKPALAQTGYSPLRIDAK